MKVHIGSYKENKPRKIEVRIDSWDTYSMDHTLALIIHPMLVQLAEWCARNQSCSVVEEEDAPIHLDWGDEDAEAYPRWKYVLDEMMWAFGEHIKEDGEAQFYDDNGDIDEEGLTAYMERKQNGFRLFGKYYQGLWT